MTIRYGVFVASGGTKGGWSAASGIPAIA